MKWHGMLHLLLSSAIFNVNRSIDARMANCYFVARPDVAAGREKRRAKAFFEWTEGL